MILIGSRALALRCPGALSRKPLDFDWVCTKEEFDTWMETSSHKVSPTKVYELPEFNKWIVESNSTPCEFEITKSGTSSELLARLVENDPETISTPFGLIPSLDLLWTIKDSHKFKKFNYSAAGFWKTAIDWHTMRSLGADFRPEYVPFHKLRQEEAYAGQKHPKLNVSKDNFFKDDAIDYRWDHDDIHVSVAPNGTPAYTLYLKDNEPVLCDRAKFFACPREVQLAGVVQEASVLAIERSKVPHGDTWSDKQAWMFALSKVCSSITSGWFRQFAFENVFDVIRLYPENYWTKFQTDIAAGKVKPFTGNKY
jgi:hypothetical protein